MLHVMMCFLRQFECRFSYSSVFHTNLIQFNHYDLLRIPTTVNAAEIALYVCVHCAVCTSTNLLCVLQKYNATVSSLRIVCTMLAFSHDKLKPMANGRAMLAEFAFVCVFRYGHIEMKIEPRLPQQLDKQICRTFLSDAYLFRWKAKQKVSISLCVCVCFL